MVAVTIEEISSKLDAINRHQPERNIETNGMWTEKLGEKERKSFSKWKKKRKFYKNLNACRKLYVEYTEYNIHEQHIYTHTHSHSQALCYTLHHKEIRNKTYKT